MRLEPTGDRAPEAQELADLALVPPDRRALFAGRLVSRTNTIGTALRVTQAWRPAGHAEEQGSLFEVRDAGIRCVKAPCPSIRATLVEDGTVLLVSEVDLSRAQASPAEVDQAADALSGAGLLVVGAPGPGPTPDIDVLLASRLYLPIAPPATCEAAAADCQGR